MTVKLLAICGSPRKATTEYCLEEAIAAARAAVPGIHVDTVLLRKARIEPCIHCNRCFQETVPRCPAHADDFNALARVWIEADAYLVASPVYTMSLTPQLWALLSRTRIYRNVFLERPDLYAYKVGAAITVGGAPHGGQETAGVAIAQFFMVKGVMFATGGKSYTGGTVWSQDGKLEGAKADADGLERVRATGRQLAKSALVVRTGREALGLPDPSASIRWF